jgi:hypothetical protein
MTCGECKHYQPRTAKTGWCLAPVPIWSAPAPWVMWAQDATDCLCFERKEGK